MLSDARTSRGLSREYAANELFIGNRTLQDYENGRTQAPPGVYLRASEIYKNPELTAHCCKNHCEIGERYCYEIKKKPIAVAALQLIKAFRKLTPDLIDELIHVAEDNAITMDEKPLIEKITEVLMRFEKPIEEWKLSVSESIDIPKIVREIEKQPSPPSKEAVL